MIQRIQSLYLFLTTLLSLLFLNGTFFSFINNTGSVLRVSFGGLMRDTQGASFEMLEKTLPLSLLFIIIPLLSLAVIFLYKNRILQMRIVMVLIVTIILSILFSGYYAFAAVSKYDAIFAPGLKMGVPLLQLILAFLAYRGIKKDETLVKSYDRLR